MKKICYTVLMGDLDDLKEPSFPNPSWEFICYTNQHLKSSTWNIVNISGDDNRKLSRQYKINPPHKADVEVYIDATFQVIGDLDYFALNKNKGIWLNDHPMRQCAYDEAQVVLDKGLDKYGVVTDQINRYREEGFPEDNKLWRCGMWVRNKSSKIDKMMKLWAEEVENGSWRDQISFPYACWKTGVEPHEILRGIPLIYFRQHLHKAKIKDELVFIGEPCEFDKEHNTHIYATKNGIAYPRWLKNYIPYTTDYQFIRTVGLFNGNIRYV